MEERPPVPAEVKRRVLVEAGHRCAITTCRNSASLDLHHIVPVAKDGQSTAENLIALCPSCHRLAERGKIDRISLGKYKEICRKLAVSPQSHPQAGVMAYIKFNPNKVTDIRDSKNICSVVDIGTLNFSFIFDKPLDDSAYVVDAAGSGTVGFQVVSQDKDSVQILFREPCPDLVRLDFKH